MVNFDAMKLIYFTKMVEALMPQGFWNIEKERKLQYQWYHNFRSYLVEATGLEPAASWSQTKHSTKLSYASKYSVIYYKLILNLCQ